MCRTTLNPRRKCRLLRDGFGDEAGVGDKSASHSNSGHRTRRCLSGSWESCTRPLHQKTTKNSVGFVSWHFLFRACTQQSVYCFSLPRYRVAWQSYPMNSIPNLPPAAAGTPLATDINPFANTDAVYYISTNDRTNEIWSGGSWNLIDVTAQLGRPMLRPSNLDPVLACQPRGGPLLGRVLAIRTGPFRTGVPSNFSTASIAILVTDVLY